jgi:Holliday junction resolvase RusA-like endonuclease
MEVIQGNVPSKSNCYKIIQVRDAHGKVYSSLGKSNSLKSYEKSFYLQAGTYRGSQIDGLFEFEIDVYYPSNRSDLDNSLKVVLDCLQHIKAIKNDNNCVKIVARKFIDKTCPRIEFQIKTI